MTVTGFHLHAEPGEQVADLVSRFDPVFWTVNFPRPMMAAVTTIAPDALRVDAVFYARDDPPLRPSRTQISPPIAAPNPPPPARA